LGGVMVELVLVFLLGVLSAGLVWLLVLPLVWRRVERLTRERIERALPLDTNEILAERDRERAAFAVQRLALEARIEALQHDIVQAKSEVGRKVAQEANLLGKVAALDVNQAQLAAQINTLEAQAAERGATIARLTHAGDAARAEGLRLENERLALLERHAAAQLQLENERRLRDETEVHLLSARAAEAQASARALALREALQALQHETRENERGHAN
jgi:hypothetical protein